MKEKGLHTLHSNGVNFIFWFCALSILLYGCNSTGTNNVQKQLQIDEDLEMDFMHLEDSVIFLGGRNDRYGVLSSFNLNNKGYKEEFNESYTNSQRSFTTITSVQKSDSVLFLLGMNVFLGKDTNTDYSFFGSKKYGGTNAFMIHNFSEKVYNYKYFDNSFILFCNTRVYQFDLQNNPKNELVELATFSKFKSIESSNIILFQNKLFGLGQKNSFDDSERMFFKYDLISKEITTSRLTKFNGDFFKLDTIGGKMCLITKSNLKNMLFLNFEDGSVKEIHIENCKTLCDIIIDDQLIIAVNVTQSSLVNTYKISSSLSNGKKWQKDYEDTKFTPYCYHKKILYGINSENELISLTYR